MIKKVSEVLMLNGFATPFQILISLSASLHQFFFKKIFWNRTAELDLQNRPRSVWFAPFYSFHFHCSAGDLSRLTDCDLVKLAVPNVRASLMHL